ncbi:unnamed protein product [Pieris brassicae]|uniref:Uncharacterized protein n=1 Tax=Pieris brassicae TaxID=7116 RepID=A0A9P0XBP0_PIEBR|nr:unnamed protein product [Pieris brassicae]
MNARRMAWACRVSTALVNVMYAASTYKRPLQFGAVNAPHGGLRNHHLASRYALGQPSIVLRDSHFSRTICSLLMPLSTLIFIDARRTPFITYRAFNVSMCPKGMIMRTAESEKGLYWLRQRTESGGAQRTRLPRFNALEIRRPTANRLRPAAQRTERPRCTTTV